MIHVGVDLDISQVINVLEASVTELNRNKAKIQNPDSKDDIDQCVVSSIKGTLIYESYLILQSYTLIVSSVPALNNIFLL